MIIRKHKTTTARGTWQIVGLEHEALGSRYWVAAWPPGATGHLYGVSRTYPKFIDLVHELDIAVDEAFQSAGVVCK